MSNRFDSGSVSAYTPQSFQELSFTPMMKRAQHDEMSKNLAELDAIATDPLNEHRDEALKLKQEFEGKLGNISGELASKGIDGIGKENFYRLKKEHDDLIAPTGRIGQINFAKKDYNAQKEEYLKNAEKQNIGRDQALVRWGQKTGDYTGYDKDKNIINVTPQGVAAYQDYEKYKQNAHDLLGKVEIETKDGNYQLRDSGLGNGTKVMVDSKGFKKESTNLDALNNAILAGNEMWLKPTGEGYKYNVDAGVDQNNFRNRFVGDFSSMLETSKGRGYEESGQFINDASGQEAEGSDKNLNPSVITEDVKTNDQTKKDLDSFENFSIGTTVKIPTPARNPSHMTPTDRVAYYKAVEDAKKKSKVTNSNDPKEMEIRFKNNFTPEQQQKYMETYNAKVAQGKIPKNINPYSKTSQDVIRKDWQRRATVSSSNQIIDVTSMDNDILASPNLIGKLDNEKSNYIQKRIANAIGNGQKLVFDTETGKAIDMKKVDLTKINLIGHYSPVNKLPNIGENIDNSVSPYKISYLDDNGDTKVAFITRDASEMSKPLFKAAKVIKKTTDKAVDNEGNFTSFNTHNLPELRNNSHGLTGLRVKFNANNQTYTIEGYKGSTLIEKTKPYSSEEYQNVMYNLIH